MSGLGFDDIYDLFFFFSLVCLFPEELSAATVSLTRPALGIVSEFSVEEKHLALSSPESGLSVQVPISNQRCGESSLV